MKYRKPMPLPRVEWCVVNDEIGTAIVKRDGSITQWHKAKNAIHRNGMILVYSNRPYLVEKERMIKAQRTFVGYTSAGGELLVHANYSALGVSVTVTETPTEKDLRNEIPEDVISEIRRYWRRNSSIIDQHGIDRRSLKHTADELRCLVGQDRKIVQRFISSRGRNRWQFYDLLSRMKASGVNVWNEDVLISFLTEDI